MVYVYEIQACAPCEETGRTAIPTGGRDYAGGEGGKRRKPGYCEDVSGIFKGISQAGSRTRDIQYEESCPRGRSRYRPY